MDIGIRPSAKSIKMKWVVRLEDKCLFRHFNVDEQPNEKPRKSYFTPKKEKGLTRMLVAIVKSVSQLGSVLQDSDALVPSFLKVESLGETRCRKSWHQFSKGTSC